MAGEDGRRRWSLGEDEDEEAEVRETAAIQGSSQRLVLCWLDRAGRRHGSRVGRKLGYDGLSKRLLLPRSCKKACKAKYGTATLDSAKTGNISHHQ